MPTIYENLLLQQVFSSAVYAESLTIAAGMPRRTAAPVTQSSQVFGTSRVGSAKPKSVDAGGDALIHRQRFAVQVVLVGPSPVAVAVFHRDHTGHHPRQQTDLRLPAARPVY